MFSQAFIDGEVEAIKRALTRSSASPATSQLR